MEQVRAPITTNRNSPCLCGSGLRFKNCCGDMRPTRKPPFGIHLFPDYLSIDECRRIRELAEKADSEKLKVINQAENDSQSDDGLARRYGNSRVTDVVRLGDQHVLLKQLVCRAMQEKVEAAGLGRLAWYENPQLLKYEAGGRFDRHTDSDYFDRGLGVWKKAVDRDYSLLMYINDDYEGGELHFDVFDYTLRPRAGLLVIFPSDFRYTHAARPVTSGVRYAIVSWAALKETLKVRERPSRAAIFME